MTLMLRHMRHGMGSKPRAITENGPYIWDLKKLFLISK